MDARNGFLVEPFHDIVCSDAPEPDERGNSGGHEEGGEQDDQGNADAEDYEDDGAQQGENQGGDDGEDGDGDCHDEEEAQGEAG